MYIYHISEQYLLSFKPNTFLKNVSHCGNYRNRYSLNFLGYYSVISAIPVEWKNVCKEPPKKMLITKRKLA